MSESMVGVPEPAPFATRVGQGLEACARCGHARAAHMSACLAHAGSRPAGVGAAIERCGCSGFVEPSGNTGTASGITARE